MAGDVDRQLICGIPDEWKDFQKRHVLFFERFPHLRDALNTAFIRTGTSSEPIDRFVFLYGRLCCEDFFEVLLCCGNGYGAAALKLLRSLYERAVTLEYLHQHPNELNDFLDFHHVQQHKLLTSIEETFEEGTIREAHSDEAKKKYKEVKDRFMVTACKKCGTKRLNHTWSKLDLIAMAKTSSLADLIVPAYYLPIRDAHATFGSLLSRLEETERGTSFIPTAQRGFADAALVTAHNIILKLLKVQEERFKVPGLPEKLKKCEDDFLEMYRTRSSEDARASQVQ